ncbi:LysM domain receptor-like kinase 4 [Vitis vinifera]|uniref:LysM domain receptor-like kinase 4 n=1 Tax=Vitis vinifera TaxID=29760 RepID=A0A438ERT9_VITVI|nr:LysM domain receptor-like kinase 4 [Vitis vinifera]
MTMYQTLLSLFILISLASCINAQQEYSGNSVLNCDNSDDSGPSSAFLYTCNGLYSSCQAFLIFKSEPPYNSVPTISMLMSSNPGELAGINSVKTLTVFPTGKEVIVPVNCSCLEHQAENGTKYLLTYSVSWEDNFPTIGERFNTKTHATQPVLDPPPPTSDSGSSISKRRIYLGAGIAAGCFLLGLSVIFSIVFLFYKKRSKKVPPVPGKTKSVLPEDLLVEIASVDPVPKVFEFKKLKKATGNFSSKSRIKGCVFRAELGREIVAVKKMKVDVSEEVNILNKLNHFNLIKLHGVCKNGSCFYLVFEYMENGSLREWLHKESSNHSQSWSKRIQIALDVANGLHYIHNFTKPAYVHKHIKSSNILLTKNLRAKIANFSLARTAVKGAKTHALNMLVVGTRGYMAPEYIEAGSITPKVDVYAFGVVMLELITGKDAVIIQDEEEVLLSEAMISIMERGNAEIELGHFLDPCLLGNNGIESATRIAKLSIACLTKDQARRPSMGEDDEGSISCDFVYSKSKNLLTKNLRAKIANFSLARTAVKGAKTHALNMLVVGTRGYMAPEYIEAGSITPKVDVYAFGVVMLELITGKDAVIIQDEEEVLLSEAMISIMERGNAEIELGHFLDPCLLGNNGIESATRIAKLSIACLTKDQARRPSMGEVVSTLMKIQVDLQKSEMQFDKFA